MGRCLCHLNELIRKVCLVGACWAKSFLVTILQRVTGLAGAQLIGNKVTTTQNPSTCNSQRPQEAKMSLYPSTRSLPLSNCGIYCASFL